MAASRHIHAVWGGCACTATANTFDSDGCRIVANYRERNGVRRRYGRYIFSNRSEQIHKLFTDSLDVLDIHWTRASFKDTAVARQRDVRRLDQFIGPKE